MIPRITDSTYGYGLGDTIIVRVSAQNIKGWGTASPENTSGAEAKVVPT
jgi:hypothetical protein